MFSNNSSSTRSSHISCINHEGQRACIHKPATATVRAAELSAAIAVREAALAVRAKGCAYMS